MIDIWQSMFNREQGARLLLSLAGLPYWLSAVAPEGLGTLQNTMEQSPAA